MIRDQSVGLGVRQEVDVMLDAGHLAEVAVPSLAIQFEYLQYLGSSVFECDSDLYRFVPALRIVDRFHLRLRDMGLYAADRRLLRRSSSRRTAATAYTSASVRTFSTNGM